MSQKKFIHFSLFALWTMALTAFPSNAEMFPNSSKQNLLYSELTSLSCDALWYTKGEIFARNGFRFSSERGIKAFGKGGTTKLPRLSEVEKYNISRIKQLEHDKSC